MSPGGRQKLTKAFLMAQETGAYVVSNSYRPPDGFRPSFDEAVAEPALRQTQWERITAARADGRLCRIVTVTNGSTQITDTKLTKQILVSLPTGAKVTSNVSEPIDGTLVPLFTILVAPRDDREAQWQKIMADGMHGKTCIVFESKLEYERWLAGQ